MAFRSEILIKLDKKGRVLLPAAFRDELPSDDRGAFVLYHSPNLAGVVNGNSRAGFDGMLQTLRTERNLQLEVAPEQVLDTREETAVVAHPAPNSAIRTRNSQSPATPARPRTLSSATARSRAAVGSARTPSAYSSWGR